MSSPTVISGGLCLAMPGSGGSLNGVETPAYHRLPGTFGHRSLHSRFLPAPRMAARFQRRGSFTAALSFFR
ncbi:MAG: hypothetical protein ACPHN2_04730 [Sinimarinibacterium flocculans]|uniref:hypothetical protein n=1 Tax=Sinimarinibacterium flocculans TaxID=985250 RepID=UPI003C47258A